MENKELRHFAQKIYNVSRVYRELGRDVESLAISDALHSALDAMDIVPQGQKRAEYLNDGQNTN